MIEALSSFTFLLALLLGGYACLFAVDRARAMDGVEKWVLSFPVGTAACGAILYTLNVSGIPFTRVLVFAVLTFGAVTGVAAATLGERRLNCPAKGADPWARLVGMFEWLKEHRLRLGLGGSIALGGAILVLGGLIVRSILDVNHIHDTELYHFPYAGIVFRTHAQPAFASQSMGEEFSFPPALFVCYAALWAWLGHIQQLLPNLLPFPFLLAWAGLTLLTSRRVFRCPDSAAAFALLFLAGIFELEVVVAGESADLLPMVLSGGAAYLAARDFSEQCWRRLPLVGMLLGLNCWVKYQGIPFALCLAAVLGGTMLLHRRRTDSTVASEVWDVRLAAKSCMSVLLVCFGVLSPFLVRNAVVFGSPLYPAALGPLHGAHADAWTLGVVGPWWQPKPFYQFSVGLGHCLREASVLLGFPALVFAWRRRDRAGIFLGLAGFLYLALFLALMNSRFPQTLRFAMPALGILCWTGGSLVSRLDCLDRSERRNASASWLGLAACAAIVAPLAPVLWLRGSRMQSMAEYGWLFIFLAGLILFHWERIPRPEPGSAAAWTAAVVAVVALLHQEPFLDFKELASGRLAEVQWARAPSLFSVTEWMQHCLNPHSVIYGYYMQRWTLPGSVLPPDDPLLESIHRPGAPWIRVMETLRQLGVDFILDYHGDPELEAYTVYQHDPVLARLGDRHFFQPVVKGSSMALYRVIYPGGALPRRPDRSNPMPWLFDFAAGGPMPPHDALSFPLVSR